MYFGFDELIEWHGTHPQQAGAALELIKDFDTVDFSEAATQLAVAYIRSQIFRLDPVHAVVHTAIATEQRAQFLVSWYYGATLDARSRDRIRFINVELGFSPIEIVWPTQLIGGAE